MGSMYALSFYASIIVSIDVGLSFKPLCLVKWLYILSVVCLCFHSFIISNSYACRHSEHKLKRKKFSKKKTKKQKTQKLVQLWEKKNGKRLQQLPRENPHETGIALPNETK